MSVRITKRAFGLGAGAVALFAVGTNVQAGWVLATAALLGGFLLIGLAAPWRGLRGVRVARSAPRRVTAGHPVTVGLSVRNTGKRPRGLLRITDDFLGTGTAVVPFLGPGTEREFRNVRDGARRGVHTTGRCLLETGAPFGVLVVRRTVDVATHTIAHPRTFPVPLQALLGRTAEPARAQAGDTSSVRDYRAGDPLRHIHWRSTARRGELVVREFEDLGRTDLTVFADTPSDPDVADAVASAACSVALAGLADGRDVHLLAARDRRPTRLHVTGADAVLDWGAQLDADLTPPDTVLDAYPAGTGVVAVLEASTRTQAAVQRLAALAASGTTVVVVSVTPSGSEPPPLVAERALRAAGAEVHRAEPKEIERCFAAS